MIFTGEALPEPNYGLQLSSVNLKKQRRCANVVTPPPHGGATITKFARTVYDARCFTYLNLLQAALQGNVPRRSLFVASPLTNGRTDK